MNEEASHLPIGQVARRAGVHVQTVRYYERRGLIEPPARRPSGQRAYAPDVVSLLRAVKTAQRLGSAMRERLADVLHAGCDALTNCTCPSCPLLIDIDVEGGSHARER